MRSRIAAIPGWVWLGAIVLLSFGVRFAFARHMIGPWIMIDEIVYSELAKSFAATGHFAVREAPTTGYGFVYPILISPAYALFHSIPTVYTGIKVVNSLLMSVAAVPAYLLARRVVSKWGALVVAVLTIAVPSGVTSQPWGLLGSPTSASAPASAATCIGSTRTPWINLVLPAATSSSAFFQLMMCM